MKDIIEIIAEVHQLKGEVALCIVTSTKGSTPRNVGAKMLVFPDGKIFGTIGGGHLEKKTIADALEVLKSKRPTVYKHELLQQHNMCCGGTMEIYIEPVMEKSKLYIFGAGHTGYALAKYSLDFSFEVLVIDDRKEYLDEIKIKGIDKLNNNYHEVLPVLPFNDNTFICIMTYNHSFDRDILASCLKKPHAYLGMIGSQRKVEMTKKMFEEGLIASKTELDEVDMPMGIDIGAESPEEIAISILAKLIAVKNKIGMV